MSVPGAGVGTERSADQHRTPGHIFSGSVSVSRASFSVVTAALLLAAAWLNNGMLLVSVFQIYLQTLQLPFDPLTICRIFARICQVLVNLSILCLGLELDNDGWELWTSGPRSAEHWGDQLVSSTFAYLRILVSTLENFHFGFKLTVYSAPMQDLSWS